MSLLHDRSTFFFFFATEVTCCKKTIAAVHLYCKLQPFIRPPPVEEELKYCIPGHDQLKNALVGRYNHLSSPQLGYVSFL